MIKSIGLKIKELRKEEKMTQKALSAKIGIDDSQLSKIEQGKLMPTLTQLLEISSIFNISLDWLTGQGSMLKDITQPVVSLSQSQQNDSEIITLLRENNATLKAQLKDKEEKEAFYREKISHLEQEILDLKKQTKPPIPAPPLVK